MQTQEQSEAQPRRRRKWSRIGQLSKAAAISEANRTRAERKRNCQQWSAREMKTVIDLYPDYKAMLEALPQRSYNQIKCFARQYGLSNKRHVWTNKEIAKLRSTASSATSSAEIFAVFPEFTKSQVRSVAKTNRILWPSRKLKILGIPVLDDVRQRAAEMNLSLVDLDAIAGGGKYFKKSEKRLRVGNLNRAIEYMGGRLNVVWTDREADDD